MPETDHSLAGYAARILLGSTLTPELAALVAAGTTYAPGELAEALRHGYHAPDTAPTPTPPSDHTSTEGETS